MNYNNNINSNRMNNKKVNNSKNKLIKNKIESLVIDSNLSALIETYSSVIKVLTGNEIISKEDNEYKFSLPTTEGISHTTKPLTVYSFFEQLIFVDNLIEDEFDNLFVTEYVSNMLGIKSYILSEITKSLLTCSYLSREQLEYIIDAKNYGING